MNELNRDIGLYIEGLGIVFHSGGVARGIAEGVNYLETQYREPARVGAHIRKGDMVGFGTGSPGDYILKFRAGYPDENIEKEYPVGIRLGICIDDGTLYIRDLYDLISWQKECDENMQLHLKNGFYHITLQSRMPSSGIVGDNQEIYVFLNQLEEMPKLMWNGVPQLAVWECAKASDNA